MSAAGQQSGGTVTASANCLLYSTFTPEPGGVNNWTGSFYVRPTCFAGINGGANCINSSVNAWSGDAAAMISGISGGLDGASEHVDVLQAGDPWAPNTLTATYRSYGGISGWAQSLFVGAPQSGFVPSFYGPGGWAVNANQAGVYSASGRAGAGVTRTWMVPSAEAFCYFTRLGGKFDGSSDSARITTATSWGTEYWVLDVTSGGDAVNGTSAQARCYAINQSTIRL